jgi:hypothetical protein
VFFMSKMNVPRISSGVVFALASAFLFELSTPLAKILVGDVNPWLLAGLLYLGSGLGLATMYGVMRDYPLSCRPGRIYCSARRVRITGPGRSPTGRLHDYSDVAILRHLS